MLRRIRTINITKIKYLSVVDKIYKVTNIDFKNLTIEAIQTDLSITDIPESEIFSIKDFRDYKIRLINWNHGGMGEVLGDVIDFSEWIRTHSM